MADLLGIEDQARSDLLGIDSRIAGLTAQKNQLLEDVAKDPGMDMGSAIGQLIAASIPALLSGGGRNLGYAGDAGATALKTGIVLNQEEGRRRFDVGKLKASSLDDQIQALAKQRGTTAEQLLKIRSEPLIAAAKAEAEQPFKVELEDMRSARAEKTARIGAGSRIAAAQLLASSREGEGEKNRASREKIAGILADSRKEIAKLKNAGGNKRLSEKSALELGGGKFALDAIGEIGTQHELLTSDFITEAGDKAEKAAGGGVVGKAAKVASRVASAGFNNPVTRGVKSAVGSSLIPNEEYLYSDSVRKAAQVVGKYLEGGKLTDRDYEEKYIQFFPLPSDTETSAQVKLAVLDKMIRSRQDISIDALGKAGYDVTPWLQELQTSEHEAKKAAIRAKLQGAQ